METDNYNTTNFTDYDYNNEGEYSGHLKNYIVGYVVYVLTSVVALIGDIIVVTLVATQRYLRSITNVYILQRALSDILINALMPFGLLLRIGYLEHFNYYNVLQGIEGASIVANALFLILISMDCYLASRPSHHTVQYRWKVLKISSGVVWIVGLLYGIAVTASISSRIRTYLPSKIRNEYRDLQPIFNIYIVHVVPLIICWIYISFIFPAKSNREIVETNEMGESPEVTGPPRVLTLALVTAHTALDLPHYIWDQLQYVIRVRFMHTNLIMMMLYLSSPVACILYLCFQKDLRQALSKCFSSRSTSNIPLENL